MRGPGAGKYEQMALFKVSVFAALFFFFLSFYGGNEGVGEEKWKNGGEQKENMSIGGKCVAEADSRELRIY